LSSSNVYKNFYERQIKQNWCFLYTVY
jgi:hypothetical protein